MIQYKHILVPLDGSELAETALIEALALAEETKAKVTLLRVVTPLPITIQPSAHHYLSETNEHEAADYLQKLVNQQHNSPVEVQARLLRGEAADTILYFAKKHGADLIVMSSHGRSGLSRFFLGSVAEQIMRQATCATLVIRANDETHLFCQKANSMKIAEAMH
ncbi:MAG: universal stress protein [Chloroflexota bacterium]